MRNIILSIISGLILAMGWPTYGFPLFLFFGFVPLLVAEKSIRHNKYSTLKTLGVGYLTFFIWNIITTWWIYNSSAFGAAVAILVNSLLMALVFLVYHLIAKRASFLISTLFLACFWMSFEYFHLQWQVSWPWLTLGNGFANFTSWIQWYEYSGVFGGSLWVWIVKFLFYNPISILIQKNITPLINVLQIYCHH